MTKYGIKPLKKIIKPSNIRAGIRTANKGMSDNWKRGKKLIKVLG